MNTPAVAGRWVYRRGELARGGWQTVVDDSLPGWHHAGLRIADIPAGQSISLDRSGVERLVIPLAGSVEVDHAGGGRPARQLLEGRESVFTGPTDVLYLPGDRRLTIRPAGGAPARVAVAEAVTDIAKPVQYLTAADVPIELRGAGRCSRQVQNIGTPAALDAVRLIVCEAITPEGNTSSYPPHKHDERKPGRETRLEEIYYFEVEPHVGCARPDPAADAPPDATAVFSAYSSPAGHIEVDARVRTGDVALVPYGFHGPAVALPGYDLYYLNVMAGPDPEREWLITDDPAHAWIRDGWQREPVDPRLPYARTDG